MKRLALLISMCIAVIGASGCSFVAWEPAPAPLIPVPPPPEDSVLKKETSEGEFFDDEGEIEQSAPAADPEGSQGLLPRDTLFGNPTREAPELSPDGKRIAFLAPDKGVLNVWVAPTGDVKSAKVITASRERPIRTFFWAYDNVHVVYLQDQGGDENWHAFSVDVASGKEIDLTPIEGVRAVVQELSHKRPHEIMLGLNDRDHRYHDLYTVDVRTGQRTLVEQNQGDYSFVTDDDFRVRFALKPTPDGGKQVLKNTKNGLRLFF